MSIHIFLGPTLPRPQAEELVAQSGYECTFHAPAQCGSLVPLVGKAEAIVLIDGVYERTPAVWHKEILAVLAGGARVFGASSMGALRAAECAPWGAEPVGVIAENYARGAWSRDDYVAVAHGAADDQFRPLTVPLVDCDDHIEYAVARGILPAQVGAEISATAHAVFYAERTWERLAAEDGRARIVAQAARTRPGLKARDASTALTSLPSLLESARPRPLHNPEEVRTTSQFSRLSAYASLADSAPTKLRNRDDWPDLLRGGLVRALLSQAQALGISHPSPQAAMRQVADELNTDQAGLREWGASVGLDAAGTARIAVEQVMLARLWEMYGTEAQKHVADHLRVTGRFTGEDGHDA